MGKQSQKRLVSKGRYIWLIGNKVGLYSLVSLLLGIGLIGALLTLVSSVQVWMGNQAINSCIPPICFAITYPILWSARSLFRKATAIEPVQPVTERNAHRLPQKLTIVRSSEIPPTEQQAELLRAAQTGQETPPEQLLRAVAGDE